MKVSSFFQLAWLGPKQKGKEEDVVSVFVLCLALDSTCLFSLNEVFRAQDRNKVKVDSHQKSDRKQGFSPRSKPWFKDNILQKVQETENHVIDQFFAPLCFLRHDIRICVLPGEFMFSIIWIFFSTRMTFHLHSYGSDDFSQDVFLFTSLLSNSKIAVERATTTTTRDLGFFLTGGATRKEWPQTAGQHA